MRRRDGHRDRRRLTRRRRTATRTLVSLTGPAGNIGDALIRRAALNWVREVSDELIVYVGDASDAWGRQVGIPSDATVLRTKRSVPRWLWLLVTSPGRPILVFEAGEVPLGRGNTRRELVFLLETLIVRAKGGLVVRPPRGLRGHSTAASWLHRRAVRASQVALWRDRASARAGGYGRVVPDIGFSAGVREGLAWTQRHELIVTLRGHRPLPGDAWLRAVRETAAASGLRIRTVVQVREDEARARELAEMLGAEFEPWGSTDPVAQEERLRTAYEHARIVLSDRMHALVLGALSGAVPVEMVPEPTAKITDAFATVGLHGVSFDASSGDVPAMRRFLEQQLERAVEVRERVRDASGKLARLEAELHAQIRAARG